MKKYFGYGADAAGCGCADAGRNVRVFAAGQRRRRDAGDEEYNCAELVEIAEPRRGHLHVLRRWVRLGIYRTPAECAQRELRGAERAGAMHSGGQLRQTALRELSIFPQGAHQQRHRRAWSGACTCYGRGNNHGGLPPAVALRSPRDTHSLRKEQKKDG